MPTRSFHEEITSSSAVGYQTTQAPQAGGQDVPPTSEECSAQVSRLTGSQELLGSEALCKLLKYLAHHTIHHPTDHLKEYEIATEAFGRSADFDPQTDSYVRVQMGRLRAKLASYYETEGAADRVLIYVPKGRYVLLFERRKEPVAAMPVVEPDAVVQHEAATDTIPAPWHGRRIAFAVAAVVLAIGLGAAATVAFRALQPAVNAPAGRAVASKTDMLTAFWSPFLQSPDEPIVVFANANFVGNAETGMRYYEPARDLHAEITQHYTGVGEVMGVLELDRLLQGHGRQFHVKRGSLFTLDDARNNNLIFVGSPTENLTLGQIPGTQEFVFHHAATGPDGWQEVINSHPKAGESNVYTPTDVKGHEGDDFAVVALRRGLNPARWTLILAGASTIGTQAAVDYVCDPEAVENLLKRLSVSKAADLKPFEALLRVKVINDVPLAVELTAVRQGER